MSDNPFRELPNTNPYASPSPAAFSNPSNPLMFPATVLLTLASLFLLFLILSLPGQIISMLEIDTSTSEGMGELLGYIVSLTVWLGMNVIVASGAFCMIRLRNYGLAYTGAIFSAIPFCSPCFVLGIPFGIWTIVLLNRPEVKERFLT